MRLTAAFSARTTTRRCAEVMFEELGEIAGETDAALHAAEGRDPAAVRAAPTGRGRPVRPLRRRVQCGPGPGSADGRHRHVRALRREAISRRSSRRCSTAWIQAVISIALRIARATSSAREGWRDMTSLSSLQMFQQWLKLSRHYGISNIVILHKMGDLDAVGEEGSLERSLAYSIVGDIENKFIFRVNTGEALALRARPQPAGTARRDGAASAYGRVPRVLRRSRHFYLSTASRRRLSGSTSRSPPTTRWPQLTAKTATSARSTQRRRHAVAGDARDRHRDRGWLTAGPRENAEEQ